MKTTALLWMSELMMDKDSEVMLVCWSSFFQVVEQVSSIYPFLLQTLDFHFAHLIRQQHHSSQKGRLAVDLHLIWYAAEFSMSRTHILNVNTAVDHLIMGSQNRKWDYYSITVHPCPGVTFPCAKLACPRSICLLKTERQDTLHLMSQ